MSKRETGTFWIYDANSDAFFKIVLAGGRAKAAAAAPVAAPVAKGGAAAKAPELLQARLGVLSLCEVKLAIELF